MKSYRYLQFSGAMASRAIKGLGLPLAVSIIFATSLAGQLAPPRGEKEAPADQHKVLSDEVRADLPRYEEVPVAAPKPTAEETVKIVPLAPFVVFGEKGPKLNEPELRTKKAFASDILKHYDYSAFAFFQYKEDLRQQDMTKLQTYADSLLLVADVEGNRAIKKESNRLFLRPHDPESAYIDTLFNARIR